MLTQPSKNKSIISPFLYSFLFALAYGIGFYVLQIFFFKTKIFGIEPNMQNLRSWDASFYDSIAHGGYDKTSNNPGFFILFPLIWRLTGLNAWGISFLNIGFFALGFAFLMKTLKQYNEIFWMLCLTIPSTYFAFLPYTESLFFLLASISLYAINEKKLWLIWVSIFLASITRATSIFFLPALFLTELYSNPTKEWLRSFGKFLYKYALPNFIGLATFIIWEYLETGVWFIYFNIQSTHWEHTFSWPSTPFSNIEDSMIRYHWLNGMALFICLIAGIYIIKQFIVWLKNKPTTDPSLIFSMGFLGMMFIYILTFNPKYGGSTTNIMGVHRYALITPFCFYFINYLFKTRFSQKDIILCIVGLAGFWQLFQGYVSFDVFIRVVLIPTIIIIAFMLNAATDGKKIWLAVSIIAFNFLIQAHLFQQFICPFFAD